MEETDPKVRYIQLCVKMPFTDWVDEFKRLKAKGRFDLIKAATTARLEDKGYVDLGAFSFMRWLEKEWFEKAKQEGVIEQRSQWIHVDGENKLVTDWVAVGEEKEEQVEVGKRGTKSIYETVKSMDFSRYQSFVKRYEEWKEKQKKTYLGHEDINDIKSLFI